MKFLLMIREDLFIVNVSSMNLDEFKILQKLSFFKRDKPGNNLDALQIAAI